MVAAASVFIVVALATLPWPAAGGRTDPIEGFVVEPGQGLPLLQGQHVDLFFNDVLTAHKVVCTKGL